MNYFHIPQPMLGELREILTETESALSTLISLNINETATSEYRQVLNRAVTAKVALSGLNSNPSADNTRCNRSA